MIYIYTCKKLYGILEKIFFSWPSEGCELSSRPNRSTSTSKENDSMTTPKAIILNFSGNVPVQTLMKRANLI
jgi:hypothetical protein